ncbi:MAG: DUF4381 domain-containing protein [Gammaproteobacteria bacterium]|nr:DUF4381 domain-containing protein [Gammaproteobacteria bacterium]
MNERDKLLAELRELYIPSVSSLPAPGWWVLLLLIACGSFLFWRRSKRSTQLRWEKDVRLEIAAMREQLVAGDTQQVVAQCSALARRLSLLADTDATHASLIQDQWLERLDVLAGRPIFTQGPGLLLLSAPYEPAPKIGVGDAESLINAVEQLSVSLVNRQQDR